MRLTRRQALILGLVGPPSAALVGMALRHTGDPGERVTPRERASLRVLSVHEYATLKAAIDRLTHDDRGDFPTAESVGAAPFAERYLADLAPIDLDDVRRLLAVLEHVLPVSSASTLPFTRADAAVQDAVLRGMETSPFALLRAGFAALKQIAALSFFRDARAWVPIRYDGPLVSRSGPREVYGVSVPRANRTHFDVDAVVVGAGAGGSMAAREIARSGARVLLIDEGPDHLPESFTQREDEMFAALYQDRGGRATRDRAIHVLQGRGLGGSTIHNQNLCKRAPDAVLQRWHDGGLESWDPASMQADFAEVERTLHVTSMTEADVNENNDALRRGTAALGWRSAILHHNRDGCRRSGFCELGCAYDGKNNARKSVIPDVVTYGGTVRAETRAERIVHRNGRVEGLVARDMRTGERIAVRARAVVLAASAVGSAALAIASSIPDPAGHHGRGLHLHPGGVVAGVFDREIGAWRGVPQSWECTEWLDFRAGSDRRVWIVPAFAHPVGTAAMLPGVGGSWLDGMRSYPHMAVLTAMVHDDTDGRVSLEYGRPMIDYVLDSGDRDQLARGLRACAEILLAAGARHVVLPFAPPRVARTASDLASLTGIDMQPHALPLTAVHPMSTMRAGSNPAHSVCDPRGEHHRVRGLYVADGGLFPTSIGGPPQITIYTAGLKVGRNVALDLARG